MYKLQFYKVKGTNKGNFDHEELFRAYEDMMFRYWDVARYIATYALRPTAWKWDGEEWNRIEGL